LGNHLGATYPGDWGDPKTFGAVKGSFDGIIIDRGSECYMSSLHIDAFVDMVTRCLTPTGIVLLQSKYEDSSSPEFRLGEKLSTKGINKEAFIILHDKIYQLSDVFDIFARPPLRLTNMENIHGNDKRAELWRSYHWIPGQLVPSRDLRGIEPLPGRPVNSTASFVQRYTISMGGGGRRQKKRRASKKRFLKNRRTRK